MITRRKFIAWAGGSALSSPILSIAQQVNKVFRIGYLGVGQANAYTARLDAFREGLRSYGYLEGKDISLEYRWANEDFSKLRSLAVELIAQNCDVIVTSSTPAVHAVKLETSTIPIVMATIGGDPVAAGFVSSLSRPGGNITGTTYVDSEIGAKRVELLKEAFPRLRRLALLLDSRGRSDTAINGINRRANALKVTLQEFGVHGRDDFEQAFLSMRKKAVEAVMVYSDSTLTSHYAYVASIAARQRFVSIGVAEYAGVGGLIGYGANRIELWRRAAYFVDKILKGTKPADLPVEQPTKFELVVNMKTANSLGVKLPNSILVRADKVIE